LCKGALEEKADSKGRLTFGAGSGWRAALASHADAHQALELRGLVGGRESEAAVGDELPSQGFALFL
jgi:hypothetical protein